MPHTHRRTCQCMNSYTHTHIMSTCMHVHTPNTHYTVSNSFMDWSSVFMFWRHYTRTHTHTHQMSPIRWNKFREKLFLVSEDILLIHPASLDSYCQGRKQRPTHTYTAPTEECCELFKGPAMLFPEPHRGFSENKAQMKTDAPVLY